MLEAPSSFFFFLFNPIDCIGSVPLKVIMKSWYIWSNWMPSIEKKREISTNIITQTIWRCVLLSNINTICQKAGEQQINTNLASWPWIYFSKQHFTLFQQGMSNFRDHLDKSLFINFILRLSGNSSFLLLVVSMKSTAFTPILPWKIRKLLNLFKLNSYIKRSNSRNKNYEYIHKFHYPNIVRTN